MTSQNFSKVSVIITSYNQSHLLQAAIESVINQTYLPYEVIVCDDASHDNSISLIKYYESRYPNILKPILHENNLGVSKNRNSGLLSATGDYVTWLDGDDIFYPRKLELELETILRKKDVKWVYSQVLQLDKKSGKTSKRYHSFHEGWIFNRIISLFGCAPRNPLVDRKVFEQIGYFNENMTMYEDFDLCIRLAFYCKCAYCPEALMEYRLYQEGLHNLDNISHYRHFQILLANFQLLFNEIPTDVSNRFHARFVNCPNSVRILSNYDLLLNNRLPIIKRVFLCLWLYPFRFYRYRMYRYFLWCIVPNKLMHKLTREL